MRQLIIVCLIFALFGESTFAAPKVRHFTAISRATISVETNPAKLEESGKLIIKDSLGRPAYVLWIVATSMDKRTSHDIELSLETIGRYASDPEGKYEPNLLSPDYWGHGVEREVIHPEEVCPANRNNPIVGARREFIFRRMRVVAKVEDVELSSDFCSDKECGNQVGGFMKMRLTITVEPSASMRRRPAGYDELGWQYLELKKCK